MRLSLPIQLAALLLCSGVALATFQGLAASHLKHLLLRSGTDVFHVFAVCTSGSATSTNLISGLVFQERNSDNVDRPLSTHWKEAYCFSGDDTIALEVFNFAAEPSAPFSTPCVPPKRDSDSAEHKHHSCTFSFETAAEAAAGSTGSGFFVGRVGLPGYPRTVHLSLPCQACHFPAPPKPRVFIVPPPYGLSLDDTARLLSHHISYHLALDAADFYIVYLFQPYLTLLPRHPRLRDYVQSQRLFFVDWTVVPQYLNKRVDCMMNTIPVHARFLLAGCEATFAVIDLDEYLALGQRGVQSARACLAATDGCSATKLPRFDVRCRSCTAHIAERTAWLTSEQPPLQLYDERSKSEILPKIWQSSEGAGGAAAGRTGHPVDVHRFAGPLCGSDCVWIAHVYRQLSDRRKVEDFVGMRVFPTAD